MSDPVSRRKNVWPAGIYYDTGESSYMMTNWSSEKGNVMNEDCFIHLLTVMCFCYFSKIFMDTQADKMYCMLTETIPKLVYHTTRQFIRVFYNLHKSRIKYIHAIYLEFQLIWLSNNGTQCKHNIDRNANCKRFLLFLVIGHPLQILSFAVIRSHLEQNKWSVGAL